LRRFPAQPAASPASFWRTWATSSIGRSVSRGEASDGTTPPTLAWPDEQKRFFAALKTFDDHLASSEPVHGSIERLFQGPVADALTHVGQLAMMRRLAGSPCRGENLYVADIAAGKVGADQPAALQPF
jgi:hypothetical protein